MKFRSFLLAGAVFPFALAFPALAQDVPSGSLILAQTETVCPEGMECPPPEDASQEAPAEEPAAEEPPPPPPEPEAQVEEVTPEAPAAEVPVEEPAPEPEVPVEEVAPEPPAADVPVEEVPLEEVPMEEAPVEEPAAEIPVEEAPAEEPPVMEAPAEEVPAEEPAAELPVEEPAAGEVPAAEEPAAEQPAGEAPAVEEPPAEGTPEDVLRRAQEQQELLQQQQQQGEQPAEAVPEEPAADGTEPPPAEPPPAAPAEGESTEAPPAAEPAPAIVVEEVAPGETVIEQQLEATGNEQEAEQVQELIIELEEAQQEADQEAEAAGFREDDDDDDNDRGDRRRGRGWWEDEGGSIVEQYGDRIIIDLGGGNIFVEPVHPDREERLLYNADDVEVQNLPGGRTRTIVYRENGSQIITVRDRRGNLLSRVRVRSDGREVVLFDYRYEENDENWYLPPPIVYGPGELPPYLVNIPEEEYIYYYSDSSVEEIQQVLLAPPIIEPERAYTVEEVTRNQGIRDIVPRIDLDTITFEFGSATISSSQMDELANLGQAMEAVITENPAEVYLIEGHTDAVGSDYDNLILSDQRAEAVAVALTYNFDVPPENLITEGYGEQYLKVNTGGPEEQNRRVTVRRITPLLQAQNQ